MSDDEKFFDDEFGDEFEVDYPFGDELSDLTESPMDEFVAEMGAYTRVHAAPEDPWIERMTNLPVGFKKFKLTPVLLQNLRSKLLCGRKIFSKFLFETDDIITKINSLATSLGHYVLDDAGTGVSNKKLKEVSQLLKSQQSCKKDSDCSIDYRTTCRGKRCCYGEVDIGSVLRYARIWTNIYSK